MRTGSVAFLFGVLLLCRLPELPSPWLLVAFPPILCWLWRADGWKRLPLYCLCGLLWALLRGSLVLQNDLDPGIEGITLQATGWIDSLPQRRGETLRFDFAIDQLRDAGGRVVSSPRKVRLSWFRQAPELRPGERWELPIRLRRPVGFMNPGGFDHEGWLFQGGIRATGYVVDRGAPVRLHHALPFNVDLYRSLLRDRLNQILGEAPGAGLITALALGDQSGISGSQWRVMARTGTSHLLAISGLHISLVAVLIFLLVRWTWPLSAMLTGHMAAQHAAAPAALAGAIAYSALAGFSVPTQRSVVMIAAWAVAQMLNRRLGMSQVLALALLVVLLFDPFSVLSPGFWLSFGAVAAIVWGMGMRTGRPDMWTRWGRVQIVVTVGLLPLLVLWFQQVPLLSVPVNLVAVPWVTLVTVPITLLGCASFAVDDALASWLLRGALHSIDMLWYLLALCAEARFSMLAMPAPGVAAAVLGLTGAFILLLPRGFPGRWLGMVWMLPLCLPRAAVLDEQEWRLAVLDVGQGLAAVIRTQNHVLLYDTGPAFGEDFTAGRAVVMPYLRHYGVKHVDRIIISHGDNDHIGGLADILAEIDVGDIFTSAPGKVAHSRVGTCTAGTRWRWDGVEFEILHPGSGPVSGGNDYSCVLQVRGNQVSALLPGDIEREGEYALLHRHGRTLQSSLLVAPHHGSATSSSHAFINAVDPQVVVFPAGYRNRFGFPKQDIIERYQRHGTRILDTARSGAIEFKAQDAELSFQAYRPAARRFWHSQFGGH